MKLIRLTVCLLFLFTCTLAQEPAQSPRPVPDKLAAQMDQADKQLAELQRQTQTWQLVRENLILSAAIELGLSKKDLETMEVTRDASGRWIFRKAAKPAPAVSPSP